MSTSRVPPGGPSPVTPPQGEAPASEKGGHAFKNITDQVKNKAQGVKGGLNKRTDVEKGYIIAAVLCFLLALLVFALMGGLLGPAGFFAALPLGSALVGLGSLSLVHLKRKQIAREQGQEPVAPKKPGSVGVSQEDWSKKWEEQQQAKSLWIQAKELSKTQQKVNKVDVHRYKAMERDAQTAYETKRDELLDLISDKKEKKAIMKKLDF
jgi:hypothetical protein